MLWIPGAAPSIAGNASTIESRPRCQPAGTAAPATPSTLATFAAIACGSPPCSTRTSNGFITPALMCASASICRPAIAVPAPGKFFSCDSFGFSCVPIPASTATITMPTTATGTGRRSTSRAQRPQMPSSGWPLSTKRFGMTRTLLIRSPSTASSAGRRVIAAITETAGISMPPMPIERMNGKRQDDHREQSDRDGRAGDDHRASGVRHRLDERGLDVLALAQLVAEAEDHQQRVVDRDAEPDERDQELHDDRDVRDVGQPPDQRERVEDRCDRDDDRHQHRRERPEDEEQDDERAETADHAFEQHARPAARAVGAGLFERVVAGHVRPWCRPGARRPRPRGVVGAALRVELRRSRRVDLHERRVPVLRDVSRRCARREVRARQRAGARLRGAVHRRLDRSALRRVARGVEDDDVRRADTDAERLQRALVRLVGGLARDREALVPALRDLAGGEAAEQGEDDPDGDDGPAMTGDEMSEASEQAFSFRARSDPNERTDTAMISATVTIGLHCGRGAAGVQEAAHAAGDRRRGDAAVRRARLRPRDRRRGRGGGAGSREKTVFNYFPTKEDLFFDEVPETRGGAGRGDHAAASRASRSSRRCDACRSPSARACAAPGSRRSRGSSRSRPRCRPRSSR